MERRWSRKLFFFLVFLWERKCFKDVFTSRDIIASYRYAEENILSLRSSGVARSTRGATRALLCGSGCLGEVRVITAEASIAWNSDDIPTVYLSEIYYRIIYHYRIYHRTFIIAFIAIARLSDRALRRYVSHPALFSALH